MDASNQPSRRGRREVHTSDMLIGQKPDILIPTDGVFTRDAEEIALPDGPVDMTYAEALAFAEEPVTIRLEHSSDKFAPKQIDFYVQGVCEWVPVGVPYTLKRKFVEVIARCKPDDITTETGNTNDENPMNRIQRYTRSKYPFSVLRDDNPKGFEWLTKVMQEG